MKQIWIIHGGSSFNTYDRYLAQLRASSIDYERLKVHKEWKLWIAKQIPEADILLPSFPNGNNAVYDEWKIYFEKLVPLFTDDVQLIGHSLGAMFLAKYLNTHTLESPVKRLILIAGGYNDETSEDLGSFKVESAKNLPRSAKEIHLFHSQDDPVVPFSELAKYQADLPGAASHIFKNRGHFNDETFPEMLELLKKD